MEKYCIVTDEKKRMIENKINLKSFRHHGLISEYSTLPMIIFENDE